MARVRLPSSLAGGFFDWPRFLAGHLAVATGPSYQGEILMAPDPQWQSLMPLAAQAIQPWDEQGPTHEAIERIFRRGFVVGHDVRNAGRNIDIDKLRFHVGDGGAGHTSFTTK